MNNIRSKRKRNGGFYRKRNSGPFHNGKNRNRKTTSSIDPDMLISKGSNSASVEVIHSRLFEEAPLDSKLKANLTEMGFVNLTQIQEETLEHLLQGRDMVGVANTGTGKTGAFLIPIIEKLLTGNPFKSLVIVPTRELALQVEQEFRSLTRGMGLYAASFIGGTSIQRDFIKLQRRNHIVIGTPGRLMDLADRRVLRLQDISVLVLDEFDRMLDMGFVHDVLTIVGSMGSREQTMLFSATIDYAQKKLINELLNDPIEVKVTTNTSTSDHIEQDIIRITKGDNKFNLLLKLIGNHEFEKVLIFAETKRLVDRLSKKLNQSGVRADLIHGNKSQNYRIKALKKFKRGKVQVLVATDVAARGIDVSNVTHVINYQLPMNLETYVHRIGRTGRAGRRGKAFTFVD